MECWRSKRGALARNLSIERDALGSVAAECRNLTAFAAKLKGLRAPLTNCARPIRRQPDD
jgi:hypothetical protein